MSMFLIRIQNGGVKNVQQRERWLPVPGYEGFYEVSDMGRVRSVDRIDSRNHFRAAQEMKQSLIDGRYLRVTLTRGGKEKTRKVHQLVLEAFVGPRPCGMEGCHNNGIATDCRLPNLRWDTKKGNADDRRKHGTLRYGNEHYAAKLSETQVREIYARRCAGESCGSLAREFGVSPQLISRIGKREIWKHLWWSYQEKAA